MITNNNGDPVDNDWKPCVTLNLATATQKAFSDTYNAFYALNGGKAPTPDLFPAPGWYDVTPQMCENMLLGKSNRKLSIATIAYYGRLMSAGGWELTGEPVILDNKGHLRDAYHRVWACLLSNTPFRTFVVTGIVPTDATMLAIDNCKPRTDVSGLEFAGLNGLSNIIAGVVRLAVKHQTGYWNPHSGVRIHKMSPKEVVNFVEASPTLHSAVHAVMAEFKETLTLHLPGKTDVACYLGWRINDLHGADVMEDFFLALGEENPVGAVALVRKKLDAEVASLAKHYKSKLDKPDALAFLIKAFNAWHTGKTMRPNEMVWGRDEKFPDFVQPAQEPEETGFGLRVLEERDVPRLSPPGDAV